MNIGLLPGFGRKPQKIRRVVGLLRTPPITPAGYGSVLASAAGAVVVNSGSTNAGAPAEYLRVRGAGRIHWLSAYSANATNRNIRAILTLDGMDVVDKTAYGLAAIGAGPVFLGCGDGATTASYGTLEFSSSCVIRASSSITETNGFVLAYVVDLLE